MLPQELTILVDGVTLVGEMYFAANHEAAPVVVMCHGMPLGPPDPTDPGYPFLAQRLIRQGFSTLIFNFRGTGPSGGNLDLTGWVQDLSAVLDFLDVAQDGPRPILMGFSAGAAVACRVASADRRVAAVALLACPANFEPLRQSDNAQAMLQHCRQVGTLRDPSFPPSVSEWVEAFIRVDPVGCVKGINPRPLLIVHGEDDDVVPVAGAHTLYAAAGEPRELVVLPGVGHHLRREAKAMAVVVDWLKRAAV